MPHKKVFHIVYRLQKTPLNTLKRIIILKHNKLRFVKNLCFTPKNEYKFLVFKELNSPKTAKVGQSGGTSAESKVKWEEVEESMVFLRKILPIWICFI